MMDMLCPPSLSLGVFEISESQDSSFKIVFDDTFYVPFGIGFWTQPVHLKKGKYRVVMPKM